MANNYQHERLNTLGQIKRFALNTAIVSGLITAAAVMVAANVDPASAEGVGGVAALAGAATVLGAVIFKMIPTKIIRITVATGTTVRVQ